MDESPKRVSTLLRVAVWLFVVCAAMAAVSLCYESFLYVKNMPGEGWDFRVIRIVGLVVVNLLFTVGLVAFGLLYLWVRMARSLPDLRGWHVDRPESEFVASDADTDYKFENYLAQEERVFKELDALIGGPWASRSPVAFSRYHGDSVCNPETIVDRNWNRSYVLEASEPLGGVLLLHGLSDAPYSLRALGQRLHAEGYTVIWLRIPGHGTSPSALANVSWHDWAAAVKVGMKGLRDRMPDGCPMYLAGYSNGGALSVHYALESITDASLPQLQGIMLFSPMIGINPMAKITRLYHAVALVSRNQKAQWSSVDAEIDPFKYSSWPMNANVQAWAVTQEVERQITKLDNAGRMEEMPPVIAMQSVVDSTVVVPKLITVLFDRLKSEASELCLFDINRVDRLGNLFNRSFEQKIVPKLKRTDLPFRLTVFRNGQSDSHEVTIQTRDGESWVEESTGMAWPDGIVSLSHVAIPIPPDDSVYGTREATADTGLSLGSLSMRGEPSALLISNSLFVRCRHNPFYEILENRVMDWLKKATDDSSSGKS
jgi:alpha-beta hydrolase superfamily lysophospholipase